MIAADAEVTPAIVLAAIVDCATVGTMEPPEAATPATASAFRYPPLFPPWKLVIDPYLLIFWKQLHERAEK